MDDMLPIYYTRQQGTVEIRTNIVSILNILNRDLASCLDLAAMFKQAHWNAKGENFIASHKLFDEIYDYLAGVSDTLGERIAAYGYTALSGAAYVLNNSYIETYPNSIINCCDHFSALSDRLAKLANTYVESINRLDTIGSKVTSNVYQDIVFNLDKYLYFLEAHIPQPLNIDVKEEEKEENEGSINEAVYPMVDPE